MSQPRYPLPVGFEKVGKDVGLHVMEWPCDVMMTEWESGTVAALEMIRSTYFSCDELVLFLETSGTSPVRFSTDLMRVLVEVEGSLEHHSSADS